jgi:hypothetical protein
MTLSDHLEALTGQRVARTPFEGLERRELAAPDRDYDGVVRPGRRAGPRRPPGGAGGSAEPAFDRMVQRPAVRYRTYGEAMEHGESRRERAERYKVPARAAMMPLERVVEGTEPWNGSLQGYTLG